MSNAELQEKGRSIIRQLQGVQDKDDVFSIIGEVYPDFLKVITEEQLFGKVWSRPALSLRERSLITLAILVVSRFHDQLKAHMRYALNVGVSQEEILEVIMHVANYTCWGNAVGATHIAGEVFTSKE